MTNGEARERVDLQFPTWPIWDEEEERNLLEVLKSGRWGIGGNFVPRFEGEFATYQGCNYCVACVNGTVALKVALRAIGIKRGDEVITSPYTFISTATVIIELGAIPIFVDVDPNTLNLDVAEVEEGVSEKTRAILPVHIGGCPADMDGIIRISRGIGIGVVEDAAQAHGAEYRGKRVGSIGDLGCFSFQSNKLVTSGEGGAITTNREQLAELCRSYVNCGRSSRRDWFETDVLGYNYRMPEFCAAVLIAQLKRLDHQMKVRERSYRVLAELCAGLRGLMLMDVPSYATRHSHYFIPFRIDRGYFGTVDKRRMVEELTRQGVPCSPGYTLPLNRHAGIIRYLQENGYEPPELPTVEQACRDVIWLPHIVLLTGEPTIHKVYRVLRSVEEQFR